MRYLVGGIATYKQPTNEKAQLIGWAFLVLSNSLEPITEVQTYRVDASGICGCSTERTGCFQEVGFAELNTQSTASNQNCFC
jgi:hypothetical protein